MWGERLKRDKNKRAKIVTVEVVIVEVSGTKWSRWAVRIVVPMIFFSSF